MISCNIGVSMQMPRERGVLPDAGAEETWNSGCGDLVCTDTEPQIGLIRNCLDYITHLSPILFRYSIVLVF